MRRIALVLFVASFVVACSSEPAEEFPRGLRNPHVGGQAPPPQTGPSDAGGTGPDGGTGDGGVEDAGTTDAGTDDAGTTDAGTDDAGIAFDTTEDGIRQFLQADGFRNWPNETTAHAVDAAHGRVQGRVFANPPLAASMNSNATSHPNGSVAVLEVYEMDGTTVFGHSLMAKNAGGIWVYFQGEATEYIGPTYAEGANSTCGQCHAAGNDFIRSSATGIPAP